MEKFHNCLANSRESSANTIDVTNKQFEFI